MHPVNLWGAISAPHENLIPLRVPNHRGQPSGQCPRRNGGDVVHKTLSFQFGQLGAAIASHRNDVVALNREDRVKNPVVVRTLVKDLFACLGVDGAQGIVAATKADEFAIRRPVGAVDGIKGDRYRKFQGMFCNVPNLYLAHARRLAAGHRQ